MWLNKIADLFQLDKGFKPVGNNKGSLKKGPEKDLATSLQAG